MKAEREIPFNQLPDLPPAKELETKLILKRTIEANKYLAGLKWSCQRMPDPNILVNTVLLQESKDSSAIENIVTTQDALYKAVLSPGEDMPRQTKEVLQYREAIYTGMEAMAQNQNLLLGKTAIAIMQKIKATDAGFRKVPGTQLANPSSGKVIYTPPEPQYIDPKMAAWEKFVNDPDNMLDPVIKMSLMHYQFEAIHPFTDGNGRTGRILNVLYLMKEDLLSLPVLYHSGYIIHHKNDYYQRLREVTENEAWENWILFMIDSIAETAQKTLAIIENMLDLKNRYLEKIKSISQKIPAYELNELLFSYPYIKIKVLEEKRIAKRQTASAYLQKLADAEILKPYKSGKEVYYINHQLMDIISRGDI
jgi:Fic family protein